MYVFASDPPSACDSLEGPLVFSLLFPLADIEHNDSLHKCNI